ncbi:uncharacterized protein LOC143517214 [Brachyhypopomus gauderio]|uniref:uncharacterized protein LOC143517214 n=1 Tax=Brachyhypopomus gauderio TaxID=698409 RepID=UPI0040420189
MKMLLGILTLTGLLSFGVDCLKESEKPYENIDQILEFGVDVFLNYLDKVKEVTEKIVRDDMLRKNRIEIRNTWNSFKETAKKINDEERGKGVQDELITGARTVRRLVMYYKDDVTNVISMAATKENIQQYLPGVNMIKGIIEKAKVNEIWGTFIVQYLPEAPPISSAPLEFLCYLLSNTTMEKFLVNILKESMTVISEIKKIDFDYLYESARSALFAIGVKANEIEALEKVKEKDTFLLTVSIASKTLIFYWDKFLNLTYTPEFNEQYEDIVRQLDEPYYLLTLYEMVLPIIHPETLSEAWRDANFMVEIYQTALNIYALPFFLAGEERWWKTVRIVGRGTVIHLYPSFEKLSKMGVFSEMKRLYFRAVNVTVALVGEDEFKTFGELTLEKWKSFCQEANRLVREEKQKSHILPPQIPALKRALIDRFWEFIDRINRNIDDQTATSLSVNWNNLRLICTKKLLASGALTQEQLDEAQRVFVDGFSEIIGKYKYLTQGMDENRSEDLFKALFKVVILGFNIVYAPLNQVWDFISV